MVLDIIDLAKTLLEYFHITATDIFIYFKLHPYLFYILVIVLAALAASMVVRMHTGVTFHEMGLYVLRLPCLLVLAALTGKTILLYCDAREDEADDHLVVSGKLRGAIRTFLRSRKMNCRITVLRTGAAILTYPLFPILVRGIVIIITDVTPLSVDPKRRDTIQRRLSKYAHRGGISIFGHDILYRRTKNKILQTLVGGKIVRFCAIPQVQYVRNQDQTRACKDPTLNSMLPDKMTLSDQEVIEGEWNNDVEFLYVKEDEPSVPLVTRRKLEKGVVYWLNSGDTDNTGAPRSVSEPEKGLVDLVSTLILVGNG